MPAPVPTPLEETILSQWALRSSRNHINVLTADTIVALPGREGTLAEMWLATQYGVPIIAYGEHHGRLPEGITRAATLEDLRQFLTRSVVVVKSEI